MFEIYIHRTKKATIEGSQTWKRAQNSTSQKCLYADVLRIKDFDFEDYDECDELNEDDLKALGDPYGNINLKVSIECANHAGPHSRVLNRVNE